MLFTDDCRCVIILNMTDAVVKESVKVLRECEEIQLRKGNDYQNPNSRIRQADYYPGGVATILDIVHAKVLRMRSVIEAMENDPNYTPNFESFEDSCKDAINYLSFGVAYSRGKIDGQDPARDFLNRAKLVSGSVNCTTLAVSHGIGPRRSSVDDWSKPDKSTDDLS